MPRIKTNDDIPDVQNDTEGFVKKYIPKVGTRDATLPVRIIRKDGTVNEGSGKFSMYTDLTPEKRAQQLSRSTGVPTPFIVEWAFHCFNGAQLEGEVHRYLEASRVSGNREFFDTSISEARDTIVRFGQNYL